MLRGIAISSSILTLCFAFSGIGFADHKDRGDAREHGYEHGYRDGFHHGMDDRNHGNKFKPEVKDADDGYQKFMGNKDQYKDGYRGGFVAGYEDAFNNRPGRFSQVYGPYDEGNRARGTADREDDYAQRGWSGSHLASDIGYRDGVAAGQSDYSRHHDARPEDQHDYHDADHGYRSDYGNKSVYQQQYRDAFVQGYRDAYRGIR